MLQFSFLFSIGIVSFISEYLFIMMSNNSFHPRFILSFYIYIFFENVGAHGLKNFYYREGTVLSTRKCKGY